MPYLMACSSRQRANSPGSMSLFDHLLLVANVAGSGESSQLRGCRLAFNRAAVVDKSSIFGGETSPSGVHTEGRVCLGHSRGYPRRYEVGACGATSRGTFGSGSGGL